MDNKKDWKNDKSVNDVNDCGCGGGTGYNPADKMSSTTGSSMKDQNSSMKDKSSSIKDQSSSQYGDQNYKSSDNQGSQQNYGKKDMGQKDQMKNDYDQDIQGKSCDSGIDGILVTETITEFYPLNDDMSDDQQNQDLNNKLNQNSEDLTDNK